MNASLSITFVLVESVGMVGAGGSALSSGSEELFRGSFVLTSTVVTLAVLLLSSSSAPIAMNDASWLVPALHSISPAYVHLMVLAKLFVLVTPFLRQQTSLHSPSHLSSPCMTSGCPSCSALRFFLLAQDLLVPFLG